MSYQGRKGLSTIVVRKWALAYSTLGSRTDQTPPIRASKRRSTTPKRESGFPTQRGYQSKDTARVGMETTESAKRERTQKRRGSQCYIKPEGTKPWRPRRSWRPALERWDIAGRDRQKEEEARAVYPFKELTALQTVGYKELFDYFDGAEEFIVGLYVGISSRIE